MALPTELLYSYIFKASICGKEWLGRVELLPEARNAFYIASQCVTRCYIQKENFINLSKVSLLRRRKHSAGDTFK